MRIDSFRGDARKQHVQLARKKHLFAAAPTNLSAGGARDRARANQDGAVNREIVLVSDSLADLLQDLFEVLFR